MGDVAMTVPIIRLVIAQHPKLKISILTKPAYVEIFREFTQANIITLDKKKYKGLLGLIKLFNELRALDIDSVIDLHNVLRTKFLKVLWGNNFYQIKKGRGEKKQLVNGKIFYQLKSTHQRYLETFNCLGLNLSLSYHKFPQKKDRNKLKLIGSNNLTSKIIGIAPFAKHKAKTYSLEKTSRLIERLSINNTILLFGGGAEEIAKLDEINRIDRKMKKRKIRENSELYNSLLSKRNTLRTQLK